MSRRPLTVAVVALVLAVAGCTVTAARPAANGQSNRQSSPAPTPSASPFLSRQGTRLTLGGAPYRGVGLDAYELATYWGNNAGCGGELNDATLDAFFAGLPAHTLVRTWGFQGAMATNLSTRARDWTGLDRVVAAAERHGDLLVISLANQGGGCDDGHWKDRAWYSGGYRNVYPGDGYTVATVSYWDWVHEIVARYRNSPAVGMWELVNEPEASDCLPGYAGDCGGHTQCPNAAAATAALRSFVDVVGGEIKRIDPNHLVESGALGGTECGWAGSAYDTIQASPGVDVASFHDYAEGEVVSGELAQRLVEARALDEPLLVGELGVHAYDADARCASRTARSGIVATKVDAMLASGAAAALLWNWVPGPPTAACSFDIAAGDPVSGLLGER